jgi:hypothetical protein
MLTPNQIHAAEYDGQSAAFRLLLLLNEHLHPSAYDSAEDRTEAASILLEAFAAVFSGCLADALEHQGSDAVAVLYQRITERAPELLASLNR